MRRRVLKRRVLWRRRVRSLLLLAVIVAGLILWMDRSSTSEKSATGVTKAIRVASTGGHPIDAAAFSPGACVSYPPTSGNRHVTVFLDAGHGGIDPGAIGTTSAGAQVQEASITLPVELDTMAELRRAGFSVVVSRTASTTVVKLSASDVANGVLTIQGAHDDVAARAVCANDAKASLLVGIYFDAGSTSSNAGSVTGYDAVRPFAAENLKFADLLQADVLDGMNAQGWAIPDEGVLTDDELGSAQSSAAVSYGHLMLLGPAENGFFATPSQMPGALIEPLFLTDPFEASIAATTTGQQVIASGIATAVEQYFTPASPASPATG